MHYLIILMLALLIQSCSESPTKSRIADDRDILLKLSDLPQQRVAEVAPKNGFPRQFEMYVSQPVDHSNPAGATFEQRIFISHLDAEAPVIFMPSGYSSSPVKRCELADVAKANQVYVAHRYMLGAQPAQLDWQYLTIEQAADDFHKVVNLLKSVYTGPWLSYGASKNGMAVLTHKRYHPQDVAATVALVAPFSSAAEDERYETFLQQAGTVECRARIQQFQRAVLRKRNSIESYIRQYMQNSDFTFTRMQASQLIEFEVLEFPFTFWQVSDGDYASIPDSSATAYQLYAYIENFGYLDSYSDEMLDFFAPVYYQAYTELGWYKLISEPVADLLTGSPIPSYRQMAPAGVPLTYNGAVLQDVFQWLQNEGDHIIYIYGEQDPWTATAIELTGSVDALKIVQPGANHSVKITDLDRATEVYNKLAAWTGIVFSEN